MNRNNLLSSGKKINWCGQRKCSTLVYYFYLITEKIVKVIIIIYKKNIEKISVQSFFH